MSYMSKNAQTQGRELKVQRLSIPFTVTASATPSAVILHNDEPEILFMQSEGVDQTGGAITPQEASPPPGSPDLGAAEDFAILASSTITNTGNTVVTGDLGLFPGTSVTGFPPGIVVGTQHITDATANQAETDAAAAYVDLAGRTSTPIAAALDAQTLSAGVYTEASGTFNLATSANGTLTLNGSATDLFIFICTSTLTTGAGGTPTITLTGGALSSNVYWVCGSSATLNVSGTGTFVGTVIATASVTANGGAVDGRLIALTAAVTLAAATAITLPTVSSGPSDSTGQLNFLVKISPQDFCFKVCWARVISRTTGIQYNTYLADEDGIDSNGDIILSLDSSVNFNTTSLDADLTVDYIVVE